MAELELEIDFSGRVFFLEFVEYINFTVSHSGACLLRTPTRTSTCANAFLLCRSSRLVPTCCAQEASSSSTLSIPNGRRRLWQVQVRPAPRSVWCGRLPSHATHNCLRAAGPRATLSRAADDPGLLGHLLFVNFLIVPVSLLAHLVCRVKVSGSVSWSSRIVTVNEWWKELVIFVRIDVSVCHSC